MMTTITLLYIMNAMLLLLHEMESAYEREWEILKLPGGITGFLLMHIPIIILLFYGLIELEQGTGIGSILGAVFGFSGLLPLLVHKLLVRRAGRFNRFFSNLIIYLNAWVGLGLLFFAIGEWAVSF